MKNDEQQEEPGKEKVKSVPQNPRTRHVEE